MGHIDAWAAGVVDSDGCITIKKRCGRSGQEKRTYYSLFVVVSQSGKEIPPVIQKLKQEYGGLLEKPYKSKKKGRRPRHTWYLAHGNAEVFLKQILPHLVGKKDQAELALKFRDTALGRGRTHLQEDFYWKMREMKKA